MNECEIFTNCVGGKCAHYPGSFECFCLDGYQDEWGNCTGIIHNHFILDVDTHSKLDINECTIANNCNVYADCTNTIGLYNCTCQDGFYGTGINCTGTDLFDLLRLSFLHKLLQILMSVIILDYVAKMECVIILSEIIRVDVSKDLSCMDLPIALISTNVIIIHVLMGPIAPISLEALIAVCVLWDTTAQVWTCYLNNLKFNLLM